MQCLIHSHPRKCWSSCHLFFRLPLGWFSHSSRDFFIISFHRKPCQNQFSTSEMFSNLILSMKTYLTCQFDQLNLFSVPNGNNRADISTTCHSATVHVFFSPNLRSTCYIYQMHHSHYLPKWPVFSPKITWCHQFCYFFSSDMGSKLSSISPF